MKNAAIEQPAWLNPLIIALTLAVALIHFLLNFSLGRFDVMFTLNGLGYLTLLSALYLDLPVARDNRRLARLALMGFTLVTVIAWVILGDKSWWVGIATVSMEVILILLLTRKRP